MPMSFPRTPSHKVFTAPCTTRHGVPHTVQTTASTADLIVTPCPNPTATPRRKSQYDPRWHLFAPSLNTLDLSSRLDQLHLNGTPPVFLPKEKFQIGSDTLVIGDYADWLVPFPGATTQISRRYRLFLAPKQYLRPPWQHLQRPRPRLLLQLRRQRRAHQSLLLFPPWGPQQHLHRLQHRPPPIRQIHHATPIRVILSKIHFSNVALPLGLRMTTQGAVTVLNQVLIFSLDPVRIFLMAQARRVYHSR